MIQILVQSTHTKIDYSKATASEKKASEDILTSRFQAEDTSLKHSPAVRKGFVSAIKSFYIEDKNLLPTGFLQYLQYYYEQAKIAFEVMDLRKYPKVDKDFLKTLLKGEYQTGKFIPRDYQIKAVVATIKNKGGIIKLPTSAGKSFIAYLITQIYKTVKILFVFDSVDLISQTRDCLIEYGMNPKEIAIIQGNNTIEDGRIILLSVMSYEKAVQLFPFVRVIIADECHSTSRTDTAQKVIFSCQNAPIHIGLSATPDKLENPYEQLKVYGNMGPIVFQRDFIDQMKDGVLADTEVFLHKYKTVPIEIVGSWADMYETKKIKNKDEEENAIRNKLEIVVKNGKKYSRKFIKYGDEYNHVVNNENRNKKIIELIKLYSAQKKRILCIFTRIEQGYAIKKMFPDAWLIQGKDDIKLRNAAKKHLRENDNAVVLASNIWHRGVDIPEIDVYINLSGGVSAIRIIQKLGRAVRKCQTTNKTSATVIDFIDDGLSPMGRKQTAKRKKVYEELGLPIHIVE